MKYWMQSAISSLLIASAAVSQAAVDDSAAAVADRVFRAGVEFCNSAAGNSRSNGPLARTEFDQYLSHLERARAIYPSLLERDPFARREATRCSNVGEDIARAEALPVIEKSLAMCQDAKTALTTGNTDTARARFSQYQTYRDQALAMTPTVLRVGSTALQVRVCDGVPAHIAQIDARHDSYEKAAQAALSAYQRAQDSCDVSRRIAEGTELSEQQLAVVTETLAQAQAYGAEAGERAGRLSRAGARVDSRIREQMTALRDKVENCRQQVIVRVDTLRMQLDVNRQQDLARLAPPAPVAPAAPVQAAPTGLQQAVLVQGMQPDL